MSEYAVFVEGLNDLSLSDIAPKIEKAAMWAINATAKRARTTSAKDIQNTFNFPGNYLQPSTGRLVVSSRARTSNLEAVITARRRATSLARFMVEGEANRKGVVIEMKRGRRTEFKEAFPINLRNNNMGLAVRTKDGLAPAGAYKPKSLGRGLWLLYGVSVDQAFNYAREMAADEAEIFLDSEFNRLLDLEGV